MHKLTPLQRAIYETDLLDLNLRDSMRTVTQRVGFFVGQQRYLQERERIAALIPPESASSLDRGASPSAEAPR